MPDKIIKRKLYHVKIEVELCVLAQNSQEAIRVGKENASNEIIEFGAAEAKPLSKVSDIPRSWSEAIPYYPSGASISNQTCKQIVMEIASEHNDKIVDKDVQNILNIREEAKKSEPQRTEHIEVKPETRPDPVPPELKWNETNSSKKLPPLRFI